MSDRPHDDLAAVEGIRSGVIAMAAACVVGWLLLRVLIEAFT